MPQPSQANSKITLVALPKLQTDKPIRWYSYTERNNEPMQKIINDINSRFQFHYRSILHNFRFIYFYDNFQFDSTGQKGVLVGKIEINPPILLKKNTGEVKELNPTDPAYKIYAKNGTPGILYIV